MGKAKVSGRYSPLCAVHWLNEFLDGAAAYASWGWVSVSLTMRYICMCEMFALNPHLGSHCQALLFVFAICKAIAEQTSNCCAIGCTFTAVCLTTFAKQHITDQLH